MRLLILTITLLFLTTHTYAEVLYNPVTQTLDVVMTEPTQNEPDPQGVVHPVTDLKETWVEIDSVPGDMGEAIDADQSGVICGSKIPATSPNGGGVVSVSCPVVLGTAYTVRTYANSLLDIQSINPDFDLKLMYIKRAPSL